MYLGTLRGIYYIHKCRQRMERYEHSVGHFYGHMTCCISSPGVTKLADALSLGFVPENVKAHSLWTS